MSRRNGVGALVFVFVAFFGMDAAAADAFSWRDVAAEVIAELDTAAQHQKAGDEKEAKRALTRAYFGVFEGRKMEAAMRKMLGQSHTFMVERQFGALRRHAASAAPAAFAESVAKLKGDLLSSAEKLDEAGVPEEVYDAR